MKAHESVKMTIRTDPFFVNTLPGLCPAPTLKRKEHTMAKFLHKGTPVESVGDLPAVGAKAPDFLLTKTDLSDVTLKDFAGKIKVLSINPSLDTGTCAMSAKKFNEQAAGHSEVVVLNVS